MNAPVATRSTVPTWTVRATTVINLLARDHLPDQGAVIRDGVLYVDGGLRGYVVAVIFHVGKPIEITYHRERERPDV